MELKEVFEPILNFMKSFQKKEKDISKQAAKDRLKLVLMQDRASVSPDFFEMMKKEIIDVIKKYIEIDEESLEVQLTRGFEAGLEGPALYANIPIKNIKPVASKAEDGAEDDIEKLTDAIAEEILDEAEQMVNEIKVEDVTEGKNDIVSNEPILNFESPKIEDVVEEIKENVENNEENKNPELPEMSVDSIAENVAKEMKKSVAKATKSSTSKTTKKSTTPKKVVKKTTVTE